MSKALIEEVEAATETIQTLRNHMSDSVPIDVAEDILDVSQRLLAALKEREWKPISEAPRNVTIDTYGYFINKRTGNKVHIRNTDDFISKTSPYPLTTTYFEYQGGTGSYTRTHFQHLPPAPEGE